MIALAAAVALAGCSTPEGRFVCKLGVAALAIASVHDGGPVATPQVYSVCR